MRHAPRPELGSRRRLDGMSRELPADRCKIPRALWRNMAAHRLPVAAALAQAGIPPGVPDDPEAVVTTAQYFAFFRALEALANDPGLGAKLVASAEPATAAHPPAMLAAFHSPRYREALERIAHFKRLIRAEVLTVTEEDGEVVITKNWPHATQPEPALSVDIGFGMLVELGRRGTGKPIVPVRVELARGEADEALARYYGGPVITGAERDRLVLRSADVDLPFPGHEPELLELLLPALCTALGALDEHASLADRVKWVLKRGLATGRRELADVAMELGTSERTLQRRITEEGTTFRELLVAARQELGRQLLADSEATIDEVAYLLGYQDTSSFHRAFREWEGVTPARWRQQRG